MNNEEIILELKCIYMRKDWREVKQLVIYEEELLQKLFKIIKGVL